MTDSLRILFVSLGRRGAATRLARDLAIALSAQLRVNGAFAVSKASGVGADVAVHGAPVFELDLFERAFEALAPWRVLAARRQIADSVRAFRPDVVVDLMPHVWAPFLDGVLLEAGVPRVALLHDWQAHPGDASGAVSVWLRNHALRADRIITLSRFVATKAQERFPAIAPKLVPLFHPDFIIDAAPMPPSARPRINFVGRLFAYKGLDLFVDALEQARRRSLMFDVGVYGAGEVGALRPRLEALGSIINNRWLSDAELESAVSQCDLVAATYKEASQSGIVAAAFGAGTPVLATPVGALPEQVTDGRTGFVAARVDPAAIADVLHKVSADPALLKVMSENILAEAPSRSMSAFLEAIADVCVRLRT